MSGVLFYNKCRIKTNVLTSIQLTEAEEKDVNFYDYDGFRLLSYTNAEALALTELPANPAVNENLTFDEWNWTLADIKTQINNVGGIVNVGAIYHTTDNKTHITCKPTETFPQAYICLTPTATDAVTVDWGDGNTDTWSSASQETKSHTYTGVTDTSVYDITITCSNGTYSFATYITGTEANNKNCIYTDIRLSNKVTRIGSYCFQYSRFLHYMSMPDTVTSFGTYCFNNCYSLQSMSMPDTVTSLGGNCFNGCYSLQNINVSGNATSLGISSLYGCYVLRSITIPIGVTSLSYVFRYCNSLQSIVIPNNCTTLGSQCFQECQCLQSITIPNSVTSLGSQCFHNCYSLKKIYVKPINPPTLANATNVIPNNENLVIYVPTGTLSIYQSAENWSAYSSKMVEYNF